VDAESELDAVVRRRRCIPLCHAGLHLGRTPKRIDDAAEFGQQAIAGIFDSTATVLGNLRIDQLAQMRSEPFVRALFVRPHQPRIAGHICGKDSGETAVGGHGSDGDFVR